MARAWHRNDVEEQEEADGAEEGRARAFWTGTISFGLVTIPVKVYSATEERDITFRQVHEKDGGRIRYRRICEVDGEEVPYSDIGKGYEMPDGRMVILTNEDLSDLPLPTAKSIEVLEFVPAEQVDPLYFAKAYYLSADGPGAKPYVLLRDALTKTGQCALVKVAIRTRETLALLREKDMNPPSAPPNLRKKSRHSTTSSTTGTTQLRTSGSQRLLVAPR